MEWKEEPFVEPNKNGKCYLYIPNDPKCYINLHNDQRELKRDQLTSRNIVIQGELLKIYLILCMEQAKQKVKGNDNEQSQGGLTQQENNKETIVSPSTPVPEDQLDFYKRFFSKCTLDMDIFLDRTAHNTKVGYRALSDLKQKHTHYLPNISGIRDSNNAYSLSKFVDIPTTNDPNWKNSKRSKGIKGSNGVSANETEATTTISSTPSNPSLFELPDGSRAFVMEADLPIAIKDDFLDTPLQLSLTVTSNIAAHPNYDNSLTEEEELERILSPTQEDQQRLSFSIRKEITVIQPFNVEFNVSKLGNMNVVNAIVENKQDNTNMSLRIEDLQFYLYDSGSSFGINGTNSSQVKRKEKIQDFFKVTIPKDDLPSTVALQDQYSFVVIIEPVVASRPDVVKDLPIITESFGSSAVFTWSIPCIQGKIISSYRVPITPPNFQDMLVSFQVESPVYPNQVFTISVTITNLGNEKRELRLIMPASDWNSVLESIAEVKKLQLTQEQHILANMSSSSDYSSESSIAPQIPPGLPPLPPKLPPNQQQIFQGTGATPVSTYDEKHSQLPIICLDHTISLGKVKPKSSVTTNLKFMALREGIYFLDKVQVYDLISKKMYSIVDNCPIYVRSV